MGECRVGCPIIWWQFCIGYMSSISLWNSLTNYGRLKVRSTCHAIIYSVITDSKAITYNHRFSVSKDFNNWVNIYVRNFSFVKGRCQGLIVVLPVSWDWFMDLILKWDWGILDDQNNLILEWIWRLNIWIKYEQGTELLKKSINCSDCGDLVDDMMEMGWWKIRRLILFVC